MSTTLRNLVAFMSLNLVLLAHSNRIFCLFVKIHGMQEKISNQLYSGSSMDRCQVLTLSSLSTTFRWAETFHWYNTVYKNATIYGFIIEGRVVFWSYFRVYNGFLSNADVIWYCILIELNGHKMLPAETLFAGQIYYRQITWVFCDQNRLKSISSNTLSLCWV